MDAQQRVRTILVPQDIVGVRPRSPARIRRTTPCRFDVDAQTTTARCGERDWFSDRLFVERQDDHARTGFGTSITLHMFGVAALLVFIITRPDIITVHAPSLAMPVVIAPPPPTVDIPTPPAEQPKPKATLDPPAPPPAAPLKADTPQPADTAPVQAPDGVTPETGLENRQATGVVGGVAGGVPGGVPGGVVGGAPPSGSGSGAPIPIGPGMQAPKKIKNVMPVFPPGVLPSRSQGVVVIEAIIGPDGKVQSAKIVHSVPALDQAALDAVRQWEYTPPMLKGVPVAVVMSVAVNFAMQ